MATHPHWHKPLQGTKKKTVDFATGTGVGKLYDDDDDDGADWDTDPVLVNGPRTLG